ncbi:hypothetical protein [Actinoplanes sp. G11-F43]|uniref:hypothetical protein n=1 Tax=Actinoplanes sp. G11-F43 TaxID=3424130 RepID=UPI003D3387BE
MTGDTLPEADPRLRALAVTVGALTALWVGVLLDGFQSGTALVALLPALLAAVPVTLPARLRPAVDTVVAGVVTIGSVLTVNDAGIHYFPLVMLLWATAVVPWRMRHHRGPAAVRLWHLAAGLLVSLPGLAALGALSEEMLMVDAIGLLYIAGPVALGVLCAFKIRTGYAVIALIGTASLILALLDGGFLFAAFWWFGGMYLTIGAVGWITTPARTA